MDPATIFLIILFVIFLISPALNNYIVRSFVSMTKDAVMADLVPPLIFALSFFILLNSIREIGKVYTESNFVALIILGFVGIVLELFLNVFMSHKISKNFIR